MSEFAMLLLKWAKFALQKLTYAILDGWKDGWMYESMDEWMDGWMYGWMVELMSMAIAMAKCQHCR